MKHTYKHLTRALSRKSLLVAAFFVFLAGGVLATTFLHKDSKPVVTLAPESVGLGEGVAACFGSTGPTCASAGVISYPVTWDECALSQGDSTFRVFIQDSNGANMAGGFIGGVGCSGSQTFNFLTSPTGSYRLWIQGEQTDTSYEGSPAISFAGPRLNCQTPTPPTGAVAVCDPTTHTATLSWNVPPGTTVSALRVYDRTFPWTGQCGADGTPGNWCWNTNSPYTIPGLYGTNYGWWVHACNDNGCSAPLQGNDFSCATMSGTVTATDCTLGGGLSTCVIPTNWTAANTSYTDGLPLTQVNVTDGVGGPPSAGPFTYGLNWFQVRANNGNYGFPMPLGAHIFTLWGSDASGAWHNLDAVRATVYQQRSTSITATCSGSTATISWAPVAGAKYYPRLQVHSGDICPAGWTMWTDGRTCYIDNYVGTSVSVPVTLGTAYSTWINTGDPVNWSNPPTASFTCNAATPPPVSSISYVCGAGGTSVTLNWPAVGGATGYGARIGSFPSCQPGWTGFGTAAWPACYRDDIAGTSFTYSITPGVAYSAWVHPKNAVGMNYNTPPIANFNCPASSNPDLAAGPISPTTATAGAAQTYTAAVTNTGAGSTGIGFSNFFQVATGPGGTGTVTDLAAVPSPVLLGSNGVSGKSNMSAVVLGVLGSGASASMAKSYTFPSVGTYSMRACADKANSSDTGTIAESNESNNCGVWTNIAVTSSCVLPLVWNTLTNSCTNSCVGGQVWDVPSASCQCPGGTTWNPITSSCIATPVCTPVCASGFVCGPGNTCTAPAPGIVIVAAKPRVKQGSSTSVTWSATNVANCTLKRFPVVPAGFPSAGLGTIENITAVGNNIASRSVSSYTINSSTLFTVSCADLSSGAVAKSVTIGILPIEVEQ